MKVLVFFSGERSVEKPFEAAGHPTFSIDWDKKFENIDLYADILTVTSADIVEKFGLPDVIWASPDCTTFSIAAISHHRRKNPETGNLDPVSDYAKFVAALAGSGKGKIKGIGGGNFGSKCRGIVRRKPL